MPRPGVNVFTGDARTGRLDRSDRESDTILFSYGQNCLPADAVSLTMPVRRDQYDASGGLPPIFEMNLPEGALRERLRLRFAKTVPDFDDLDLLAVVGSSQIGRLRYSRGERLEQTMPTQNLQEILTYRGTADLFAHLLERFATHSGISGIQPKVLVRDEKAPAKRVDRGATHIVKAYDSAEYPELAANEVICTHGAAAAGIETTRLALSDNRRLLVADRFDLRPDGSYFGLEDFCVLSGLRAHGRYDGSYEGVARRLGNFVSPRALSHALEQYALVVASLPQLAARRTRSAPRACPVMPARLPPTRLPASRSRGRLCSLPLIPAPNVLLPRRRSIPNEVTEVGRRRKRWGRHLFRVIPLLIADGQVGHQRRVDQRQLRRF